MKFDKPEIPPIVEIKDIKGWGEEVHMEKGAMQFHLLCRPEGSHWSKLRWIRLLTG